MLGLSSNVQLIRFSFQISSDARSLDFSVFFHSFPPFLITNCAACYVAVDQKVDVRGALSKVGLLSQKTYDDAADVAEDPAARGHRAAPGSARVDAASRSAATSLGGRCRSAAPCLPVGRGHAWGLA